MLPNHYECVSLLISESLFTQVTAEQMYRRMCVDLVYVWYVVYTRRREAYRYNNLFLQSTFIYISVRVRPEFSNSLVMPA